MYFNRLVPLTRSFFFPRLYLRVGVPALRGDADQTHVGGHLGQIGVGGDVKGGKVFGKWPGLQPEQLYEGRDLALTTDFRSVFAEVAGRHLGATQLGEVFPGYSGSKGDWLGVLSA